MYVYATLKILVMIHFLLQTDRSFSYQFIRLVFSRYPLEIHVVFYKSRYLTQDAALKHDDGLVVAVYLVKVNN